MMAGCHARFLPHIPHLWGDPWSPGGEAPERKTVSGPTGDGGVAGDGGGW
jgi:hypothetical protein